MSKIMKSINQSLDCGGDVDNRQYTQRRRQQTNNNSRCIPSTIMSLVIATLLISSPVSGQHHNRLLSMRNNKPNIETSSDNNNHRQLEDLEVTILPSFIQTQLNKNSNTTAQSIDIFTLNKKRAIDTNNNFQPTKSNLRIINGIETQPTRYPYSASLQYSSEHFCGGALIASDVVITAGHCNGALSLGGITYNAVINRHNLQNKKRYNGGGESIRVKKEIRHPQYNPDTVNNDFNLIFLNRAVQDTSTYLRVNPNSSIPQNNKPLTVIGYGDTDIDESISTGSNILMETVVYSQSNLECESSSGVVESEWGPVMTSLKGGITDNMICAWNEGSDACQGDSGGPLIQRGSDKSGKDDVLVGIVSWGLGCADDNFPGGKSAVSAQYDWIRSNICEHSINPPSWYNCNQKITNPMPIPTPRPSTRRPSPRPTTGRPSPRPTRKPISPTPPPTQAPTQSPLPSGKQRLFIVLTLDANPSETGWILSTLSTDRNDSDGSETVIKSIPIGSYASSQANKVKTYEVIVDTETYYNMTIYDSNGNGFSGKLTVYEDMITSDDSTALVKEPGFSQVSGTAVSHGFYVGISPAQFLVLSFTFDYFAHEVAYEVKNNDDVIFALAWFQTFSSDDATAKIRIPIYPPEMGDQQYSLRLWDSGNDGICCDWGNGGYRLYLGDPDTDGKLLKSGGDYGTKDLFQFVVEGYDEPSISPTPKSSEDPTVSLEDSYPTYSPSLVEMNEPYSSPPTKRPSFISSPINWFPSGSWGDTMFQTSSISVEELASNNDTSANNDTSTASSSSTSGETYIEEEGSDTTNTSATNESEEEDGVISDIDEISKDEGEDKVVSAENVDTSSSGSTMSARSGMWYSVTMAAATMIVQL